MAISITLPLTRHRDTRPALFYIINATTTTTDDDNDNSKRRCFSLHINPRNVSEFTKSGARTLSRAVVKYLVRNSRFYDLSMAFVFKLTLNSRPTWMTDHPKRQLMNSSYSFVQLWQCCEAFHFNWSTCTGSSCLVSIPRASPKILIGKEEEEEGKAGSVFRPTKYFPFIREPELRGTAADVPLQYLCQHRLKEEKKNSLHSVHSKRLQSILLLPRSSSGSVWLRGVISNTRLTSFPQFMAKYNFVSLQSNPFDRFIENKIYTST